jgi:hypothetical protein
MFRRERWKVPEPGQDYAQSLIHRKFICANQIVHTGRGTEGGFTVELRIGTGQDRRGTDDLLRLTDWNVVVVGNTKFSLQPERVNDSGTPGVMRLVSKRI